MNNKASYIRDILAYFILSIISTTIAYSELVLVEDIENEYTAYRVYTYSGLREYIGYLFMFVAIYAFLDYIRKVNKNIYSKSIPKIIIKESFLLLSIGILTFLYLIMPYVLLVDLPNKVIYGSKFTYLLKNIIIFLPFVYYLISLIITVKKKIDYENGLIDEDEEE